MQLSAEATGNSTAHKHGEIAQSGGDDICGHYRAIRQQSEVFCAPLHTDDFNLQAMPETSPPKWHLAHTTWFFETFVLKPFCPHYQVYNTYFESLFNSYYTGIGTAAFPRAQRGLLSRPTTTEVFQYRSAIDQQILALLKHEHSQREQIVQRIALGLQHEQQHQELLLTDIKYGFSINPMTPVYCNRNDNTVRGFPLRSTAKPNWTEFSEGMCDIGAEAGGFYFDNEAPRHRVFLHSYALANCLVSNGEYLAFIEDKGYQRPELWLADGWQQTQQYKWEAPLYWRRQGHVWQLFTLHGEVPLNLSEPVCHVSYYEADAFARWSGARLPTELEWENAVAAQPVEGRFVDDGILHPRAACGEKQFLQQLYGDVWEWTASAYSPYPGYAAPAGAIGEYNGKFMCNQMVLRGGSCASARSHLRASYRNFFYPGDRWQFSGIRLARSLH